MSFPYLPKASDCFPNTTVDTFFPLQAPALVGDIGLFFWSTLRKISVSNPGTLKSLVKSITF